MKVIWSRRALEDIKGIRRYIAQYHPQAAARIAARIRKTRDLLRRHPLAGHEGREPGTREFVVDKRYIVIHQVPRKRSRSSASSMAAVIARSGITAELVA